MKVKTRWDGDVYREARIYGASRRDVKAAAAEVGAKYTGRFLQPTVFGSSDQITQVVRRLGFDSFTDTPGWDPLPDGGVYRGGNR